jgi:hypothetical protein
MGNKFRPSIIRQEDLTVWVEKSWKHGNAFLANQNQAYEIRYKNI